MKQLLLVSAIVMGLSQTLTGERIFEPLRRALGGRETQWPTVGGLVPLAGGIVGLVLGFFQLGNDFKRARSRRS